MMSGLTSRTDDDNLYLDRSGHTERPTPARIYDYYLDGGHNFAVDRAFATAQEALWPGVRRACRENRYFLGRAVNYATRRGVTQFLDIGSGIPTAGNVHEAADRADLTHSSRVVYVDCDPIATADAQSILERDGDPDRHRAIAGDFLEHDQLWTDALDTGLIDPTQPICLLTVALLHFFRPAQDPHAHLAWYRHMLPPGSLLVLSHGVDADPRVTQVANNYNTQSTNHAHARNRAEIAGFFGDFTLIDPGLVWAPDWRPDDSTAAEMASTTAVLAGIAEKPAP